MQSRTASNLPLVLLVLAGGYFVLGDLRGCTSPVRPAPPPGPDLVSAFATNDNRAEARAHAAGFACLCRELAECLQYDGQRGEPRIKTGVAIDDLRWAAREMRFRGVALGAKYPGLKDPIAQFFTQRVGTSGGKLDAEKRAAWISAFRDLAESAAYASKWG